MDLKRWSDGEVVVNSTYSNIIIFMAMQKLRDEIELQNYIQCISA